GLTQSPRRRRKPSERVRIPDQRVSLALPSTSIDQESLSSSTLACLKRGEKQKRRPKIKDKRQSARFKDTARQVDADTDAFDLFANKCITVGGSERRRAQQKPQDDQHSFLRAVGCGARSEFSTCGHLDHLRVGLARCRAQTRQQALRLSPSLRARPALGRPLRSSGSS